MTSRYYKEKGWDAASERTVVNLKEFNNGLLAHGSESKPQVSITGYHIAHIKTPVKDSTHCRDIEPATQIQRNSRIYKGSRKHTHTHTQMCSRCASLSRLAGRHEKRLYNICVDVMSRPKRLGRDRSTSASALHPRRKRRRRRPVRVLLKASHVCVKLWNGAS